MQSLYELFQLKISSFFFISTVIDYSNFSFRKLEYIFLSYSLSATCWPHMRRKFVWLYFVDEGGRAKGPSLFAASLEQQPFVKRSDSKHRHLIVWKYAINYVKPFMKYHFSNINYNAKLVISLSTFEIIIPNHRF